MRNSLSCVLLFVLISVLGAFSPPASAQLSPNSNTTSAPIPGVGHDYLGGFNETVNPANGSINITVPVIMPPGRGITLPFSFTYGSNGVNFVAQPFSNPGLSSNWYTTNSVISQAGWSNTGPIMSASRINWKTANDFGKYTISCSAIVNYVFQDARGARHNMGLTSYSDPNGTEPCTYNTNDWPRGFEGALVTQGGEGSILATTPPGWTPAAEPVTVTDADGTVYSFPGHTVNVWTAGDATSTWFPSSVTDRNGNIIYSAGASQTDTTGRAVLQDSGFAVSPETVTVSGLGAPYTLNWTTLSTPTFSTPVSLPAGGTQLCGTPGHSTWSTSQNHAVSSLTLPNGKSFTFAYDPVYGLLKQVTYPTGGYVRYVWGMNTGAEYATYTTTNGQSFFTCSMYYGVPAVTDRYVSFDGTTEVEHQSFLYATNWDPTYPFFWDTKTTTVTTYDLVRNTSFQTKYRYGYVSAADVPNMDSGLPSQIPVESSIAYYNDLGATLLKTVNKGWINERTPAFQQNTLPNGPSSTTSLTVYCYNSSELETEHDDYDFGNAAAALPSCSNQNIVPPGTVGGSLLRKTVTNYATSTAMTGAHVVDRPASVIVYDGSSNKVAETDYTYDNPVGSTTSGIVQHSGGCNCGNLTVQSQWLNVSGSNSATNFTNDDTGQRLSMTDPLGHQTSYSFTDSYSSGTPPGPTNAYLTTITLPQTSGVSHIQKYAYAYASGEVNSYTDQNNQVTSYKYVDNLARLTETDFPDGGKTTIAYNDAPYNPSTPSPSVTTTKAMTSTTNLTTLTALDGLGHAVTSALTSDPDCATGDRTDTSYTGLGQVYTVSNPYCVAGEPTSGLTTYAYDALGRTIQVMHPDSSTVLTTYSGRATQVQDEGNGTQRVTRVSQSDGLGRLLSLCEVAPGPFVGANGASTSSLIGSNGAPVACGQDIAGTGFLTSYQYDTLSNLLQVNQTGIAARTFNYDSLSRLLCASNPENSSAACPATATSTYTTGTTGYAYDANGNLSTKIAPAPNQIGSATVTTTYQYDALNRLTNKSYSDGTTPTVSFTYDTSSGNQQNLVGRLSLASVPGWLFYYGYDAMGRISQKGLYTPNNGLNRLAYSYDLLGDLTSEIAGYGYAYYGYNTAARLTSVTSSYSDANNPANLFSSTLSPAHYNAFGGLTQNTLGDGEIETYTYDKRERTQSYTAKLNSTTIYSFNIGSFAPNGDILSANDSANGNWTYTYDQFNRLVGSNQNSGQAIYNYVYDRFGNRWQQNGPHTFIATFSGSNNRMDGYSYDAAGNLLNDGVHQYKYDAENRMIQVDSGNTASYVYDSDGRRVMQTTSVGNASDPAGSYLFMYDLSGRMLFRQLVSSANYVGNVYAGSRHLINVGNGMIFSHSDWLGTERVRNQYTNPTYLETCSSLPFGDGLSCQGNGEVVNLHFTGKERDVATGLDYFGARYNSSSFGRFMSADPENAGASEGDAQSWNAYSYARNNPLNLTDPDGRDYKVCIDNGNGGLNCTTYDNFRDFQKALNGTGATLNGDAMSGQILVNGKSVGSYQFFVGPGVEAGGVPDITADYFFNFPALFSGVRGAFSLARFGIRGMLSGAAEETGVLLKLKPGERAWMQTLRALGRDVKQLPVGPGKSADFLVDGVKTEIKILEEGEGGATTIKNAIEKAAKQGENIIIDAQSTNLSAEQAANQIARAQGNIGGLQGKVLVYTKEGVIKF